MSGDLDLLNCVIEQEIQESIVEAIQQVPEIKIKPKRKNTQAQKDNLIKGRAVRSRLALIRKQYRDEERAELDKAKEERIMNSARNIAKRRIREEYEANLKYPNEQMTDAELKQMVIYNNSKKNQVKEIPKPNKDYIYC